MTLCNAVYFGVKDGGMAPALARITAQQLGGLVGLQVSERNRNKVLDTRRARAHLSLVSFFLSSRPFLGSRPRGLRRLAKG
jgi:hypothetical protein